VSATRAPSLTAGRAAQQRQLNTLFAHDNATRIASVVRRLRAHARRCRTARGYKALPELNRSTSSDAIAGTAKQLETRVRLRLSVPWWTERAEAMLLTLDGLNGRTA